MLIMIPLTAFLIGPIGVYAGAGLGSLLKSVNDFSPLIFAIVIPLAYPFMVPLGLHWPINAIMLINIQTLGYDFIQGPMGAWNFACFGATAGVLFLAWRERDTQMRQTAIGALAAGLLGGISEPSLYGIHLRFKRIYPRMLVGCLVGGLIIGIGGGVTTKAFVFTSLLTIPAFSSMGLYAVAVLAAFFTSMVLVIFSGYKSPEQAAAAVAAGVSVADLEGPMSKASPDTLVAAAETKAADRAGVVTEILSPLAGTVVPLADVPDPVFSKGTMGPGVAVLPSGDTAYSPGSGVVVAVQPSGHAFGLVLDGGIEVLIHIGIDTVALKGEGFDVKVTKGQKVSAGTPLVTFDRKVIEAAGYPLITPIIVLNGKKFGSVEPAADGEIAVGAPLLAVTPAPAPRRRRCSRDDLSRSAGRHPSVGGGCAPHQSRRRRQSGSTTCANRRRARGSRRGRRRRRVRSSGCPRRVRSRAGFHAVLLGLSVPQVAVWSQICRRTGGDSTYRLTGGEGVLLASPTNDQVERCRFARSPIKPGARHAGVPRPRQPQRDALGAVRPDGSSHEAESHNGCAVPAAREMQRALNRVPPAGFEPATPALGEPCSIP